MMNLLKHLFFVLLCVFSAISQAAWSVRYQHTDVLGSVIAESNAQGTITQRFGYKPFGEGSPTQKTGVGYTGHLEDTDLGLTYMQQRYYDPVIGRFYSNDPVGFSADNPMMFNRYAYSNNNPYKYIDPTGESAVGALTTFIATDVAVPEPTDAAVIPKAIVYTALMGVAVVADKILISEVTENPVTEKPDTLTPGEHAGESIPARGPGRDFKQGERDRINQIGKDTGCHTCGSTEPGTKSGNFVPDHQPPTALNPEGKPQELYPQCINCSRTQGGQIRAEQIKQQ